MWLKKAFILVTIIALTYGCHSSANGDLQKRSFRFEDEEETSADKISTEERLEPQVDRLVQKVENQSARHDTDTRLFVRGIDVLHRPVISVTQWRPFTWATIMS